VVRRDGVVGEARKRLADTPLADWIDVPAVFVNVDRDDERDAVIESGVLATLPAELISEVRVIRRLHGVAGSARQPSATAMPGVEIS
jgi:hypothetical protein